MVAAAQELLEGAVDLHYHPGPSPFPRRLDEIEAALHFESLGFAAVIYKSHHHNTAMDVQSIYPHGLSDLKLKVYGGIAMNSAVGGLNPAAVELCLKMGGKIVWLPTLAAACHVEHYERIGGSFMPNAVPLSPETPIRALDQDGKVVPEILEICELVAEQDAILASGHLFADEIMAVFAAAKGIGVKHLLVNHPNFLSDLSIEQCKELVALGAYVEHEVGFFQPGSHAGVHIEDLVPWIRAIGPEHTVLSSDTGQTTSGLPSEVYTYVCEYLLENSVSREEITQLVSKNPKALLELN